MIGEPLNTLFVVEFDNNWTKYFDIEKENLRKYLPFHYVVEHVGSTSIPGMPSRPIVDILIGFGNLYDLMTAKDILANAGYTLDSKESHLSYYSFYRNIGDKRYFNVYLTTFNSPSYKTHIGIRNYFLNNKDKAFLFAKTKADLVRGVNNDKEKYLSLKKRYLMSEIIPFIDR